MPGSRMPPSQVDPLPSRNRPADPPASPCVSHGPLSLVKKTNVFRSRPSCRSASSTRPTLQSISSTTSPYRPRRLWPRNLPEANSGTWGKVCAIEEEGRLAMAGDELHSLLGIAAGEGRLIGRALDPLLVAIQAAPPTIRGPGRGGRWPPGGAAAWGSCRSSAAGRNSSRNRGGGDGGPDVGVVAQVPLAQAGRRVAPRPEGLGDGDFAGGQAARESRRSTRQRKLHMPLRIG